MPLYRRRREARKAEEEGRVIGSAARRARHHEIMNASAAARPGARRRRRLLHLGLGSGLASSLLCGAFAVIFAAVARLAAFHADFRVAGACFAQFDAALGIARCITRRLALSPRRVTRLGRFIVGGSGRFIAGADPPVSTEGTIRPSSMMSRRFTACQEARLRSILRFVIIDI